MQQPRQHQARRPRSDDSDLRAHEWAPGDVARSLYASAFAEAKGRSPERLGQLQRLRTASRNAARALYSAGRLAEFRVEIALLALDHAEMQHQRGADQHHQRPVRREHDAEPATRNARPTYIGLRSLTEDAGRCQRERTASTARHGCRPSGRREWREARARTPTAMSTTPMTMRSVSGQQHGAAHRPAPASRAADRARPPPAQ